MKSSIVSLISIFSLLVVSGAKVQFGELIGQSVFSSVEVKASRVVGILKNHPVWLDDRDDPPTVNTGHLGWQSFIEMELDDDNLLTVSVNGAAHMILVRDGKVVYSHDMSFSGKRVTVELGDYIIFAISNRLEGPSILKTLNAECELAVGETGPIDYCINPYYYFDRLAVKLVRRVNSTKSKGKRTNYSNERRSIGIYSGSDPSPTSRIIITSDSDESSSSTFPHPKTPHRTLRSRSPRKMTFTSTSTSTSTSISPRPSTVSLSDELPPPPPSPSSQEGNQPRSKGLIKKETKKKSSPRESTEHSLLGKMSSLNLNWGK